jgi:hypothetical protein
MLEHAILSVYDAQAILCCWILRMLGVSGCLRNNHFSVPHFGERQRIMDPHGAKLPNCANEPLTQQTEMGYPKSLNFVHTFGLSLSPKRQRGRLMNALAGASGSGDTKGLSPLTGTVLSWPIVRCLYF